MSDLVERLRNYSGDMMLCDDYADAMQEAADEIERLRNALKRVKLEAISLADAQVIALEALRSDAAMQAKEQA